MRLTVLRQLFFDGLNFKINFLSRKKSQFQNVYRIFSLILRDYQSPNQENLPILTEAITSNTF